MHRNSVFSERQVPTCAADRDEISPGHAGGCYLPVHVWRRMLREEESERERERDREREREKDRQTERHKERDREKDREKERQKERKSDNLRHES